MMRPQPFRPLCSHLRIIRCYRNTLPRAHKPTSAFRCLYSTPSDPLPSGDASRRDASNTSPSSSSSASEQSHLDGSSKSGLAQSEVTERTTRAVLEQSSPFSHFSDAPQPPPEPEPAPEPEDFVSRMRLRLREWATNTAIQTRLRTDNLVVRLTRTLSQAGGEINRVTGYEQIDVLKRNVIQREERIAAARTAAREAKTAFEAAVRRRSSSQKEVNDLLQRKSMWTEADVGRFTELVREDHALEQAVVRLREAVEDAEVVVEREFTAFMRAILDRYHEEQVWSDKIRSVSTYGSLAVVGVNLFVFLLAIVFVEPWKRRRLAQTFERKVEELEREHLAVTSAAAEKLERRMEAQDELLGHLIAVLATQSAPPPPQEAPSVPSSPPYGADEDRLLFFDKLDTRKLFYALNFAAIGTAAVMAALAWLDT